MIRMEITKDGAGRYRSFVLTGHAGFADAGKDIICAGVSALVLNTVNSLTDLVKAPVAVEADEREGGYLKCSFTEVPDEKATLLVDSMILGLTSIGKQYGKTWLKLRYKVEQAEKADSV